MGIVIRMRIGLNCLAAFHLPALFFDSASAWSTDNFFDQIKLPRRNEVSHILEKKQFKFVGNHWTDFSNNYGGCEVGLPVDLVADSSPTRRHQPLLKEEECFAAKCMTPLRSVRRYKVHFCTNI